MNKGRDVPLGFRPTRRIADIIESSMLTAFMSVSPTGEAFFIIDSIESAQTLFEELEAIADQCRDLIQELETQELDAQEQAPPAEPKRFGAKAPAKHEGHQAAPKIHGKLAPGM
jgi:hypothetical protein